MVMAHGAVVLGVVRTAAHTVVLGVAVTMAVHMAHLMAHLMAHHTVVLGVAVMALLDTRQLRHLRQHQLDKAGISAIKKALLGGLFYWASERVRKSVFVTYINDEVINFTIRQV